jgi:hypothetical protein
MMSHFLVRSVPSILLLLNIPRQLQRPFDVAILGSFTPPGQQDDYLPGAKSKVDSITRAMVDAHFGHTFTHRFDIARISQGCPSNANIYAGRGCSVSQRDKPRGILFGLMDFIHQLILSRTTDTLNSTLALRLQG